LKKNFRPAAILSLLIATLAVWLPALRDGFVWDDTALVLRDPLIRNWRLIPEGFRHFLFTDATASNFYRPVQRLSFTFDYALFAFNPVGWHLTSVLLHAAAAVALFLCAARWLEKWNPAGKKNLLLAWIAALAWAVHPVHSAAVVYVSGRADVLAALFGFAALFFAARNPDEKKSRFGELPAALCFLAAMLSKESGAMALVIWLAVLFATRDFARLRRWALFAAAIFTVYCSLRFSAENTPPPDVTPTRIAARPILMARAVAEYAGLLVAPTNLHMERDLVALDHGDTKQLIRAATLREYQTLLGLALITGLGVWIFRARKNQPAAFLFLVAFVLAYLPVSNLFSLNASAAEHWLYFNSAFLFVAAALSISVAPLPQRPLAIALGVWIACLGARSFARCGDWKNQRTFLESTAICGGDTARVEINLGVLESSEGRQKIAVAHFENALHESPGQPFALLGLASAQLRAHDYAKARELLAQAEKIPFVQADALQSLAVLEWQRNQTDRIDLLKKAAQIAPKNWAVQKRYITHLDERGETLDAVNALRAVLERQPFRADSWKLLADLLAKIGQPDFAAAARARAAELDVHLDETASPKI
jgi:tetratricopeptide (TPR) repeat protein